MNNRLKQSLIVFGFVGFGAGILWTLYVDRTKNGIEEIHAERRVSTQDILTPRHIPMQPLLHHGTDDEASINPDSIRKKIEQALGLSVVTISVSLERPPASVRVIPWRENKYPVVKLSLPSTWLENRSKQIGSDEAVLESLRSTITSVVPGSQTNFQIVHEPPIAPVAQSVTESYAKQIAIVVGLFAVLLSGLMIDRRRPQQETVVIRQIDHPKVEANRILQLEHSAAKAAIDTLSGSYKITVLQQIVGTEVHREEAPVVHIQSQQETDISKCS